MTAPQNPRVTQAIEWARKVAASKPPRYTDASRNAAAYILELEADEAASKAERRNLVSHATGGRHTGEGMSLNDVCVAISAFRNRLYANGKEIGRQEAEAASKAREAALVEALRSLEYWFDTDPEILDALTDAERADNARQLAKIRAAISCALGFGEGGPA